MSIRRTERPPPGRPEKSTPPFAKTSPLGKAGAKSPVRPSRRPAGDPGLHQFVSTWPLFGDAAPSFPADPAATVNELAPPSSALAALADHPGRASEVDRSGDRAQKRLTAAATAADPEWLRAASALSEWLQARIAQGSVQPLDQAAIARTWAAFCLGGATEAQILRVAHVVQRAHTAIRETPRSPQELNGAFYAAAGVLHSRLPAAIKQSMPLDRVVFVVRKLREEANAWTAIVDGTSELLGWTDYGRVHAATAIRAVLERSRGR
jgi:hypothetical protein